MKSKKQFFIIPILIVILGSTVGFAFLLFQWQTVQPVDLGVKYSDMELESFSIKMGEASSGFMAGGVPVFATFTDAEVTAFLSDFAKKQNFPIKKFQILFHNGSFTASGVLTRSLFVRGDVLLEGTVIIVGPSAIHVNISEASSRTAQITKGEAESLINKGIQDLFDRFAPAQDAIVRQQFLNIQKIEFEEGSMTIEGIFPLEFVPGGSNIRL